MKKKVLNALKWFYKSYIWLFIVLLTIDIVTKQIIIHSGEPGQEIADWGFVHINYVLNYNAAFGLGADNPDVSRTIYLIVASVISAGLIFYLIWKRKSMKLFVRACLILVITGALGNMIDRIFYAPYHAVVDWIDFYWFWSFNFNIADCCIVIAAFMLVIYVIIAEVKDLIARRNAEVAQENSAKSIEQSINEDENDVDNDADNDSGSSN